MATDVKRSNHNPFRTPTASPNPTGAGPSAGPLPSSARATTPQLPASTSNEAPLNEAREPRRAPSPVESLSAALGGASLDEAEPPPAYTPAANMYTGEATVEYGPTRPFQRAPPAPPLPQHFTGASQSGGYFPPQNTGLPPSANVTPTPTGWERFPGQGPRQSNSPFMDASPRHPSTTGRASAETLGAAPVGPPVLPRRPLSDFARDFYASGSDPQLAGRPPSPTGSSASSDDAVGPEHYEGRRPASSAPTSPYAPPPGPPQNGSPISSSQYGSPPGPPPRHPSSQNSASLYTPPPGPPPSQPSRRTESTREDWKPTTTPTPGRPLLNGGNVLVYPVGHECRKCLNTGYKNFDPSHPCRRCWSRYGRPYTGPIIHAPQSPQSQRPLPTFRPPHLRHRHSSSQPSMLSPSPLGCYFPRSQSVLRPGMMPGAYPGRAVSNPGPPPPPTPSVGYTRGRPPPGSEVVQPGDSRIGGRICWRCGGDGIVSYMIFDANTCSICNGLGRTFN